MGLLGWVRSRRRGVIVTRHDGTRHRHKNAANFTPGADGKLILLDAEGLVVAHLEPDDWRTAILARHA